MPGMACRRITSLAPGLLAAVLLGGACSSAPPTPVPECEPAPAGEGIRPTRAVAPNYPTQAHRKGTTGHVVLAFEIRPNGKPAHISVIESQPDGVFDAAAKRALSQWDYAALGCVRRA